jgi:hypothetical protein
MLIIRIFNCPLVLEQRLGALAEREGEVLLLPITDRVPARLFTLTSQEPTYERWSKFHGIYFIFYNGQLEYLGMSIAKKETEHGLAGCVYTLVGNALVRRHIDAYTVSLLAMDSVPKGQIVDVKEHLIDVLNPPANVQHKNRLQPAEYQIVSDSGSDPVQH